VNASTIVLASLLLTMGATVDRVGARRMLFVGSGFFVGGSLAAALAPTLPALVAAQVALGAGSAALIPASLAVVSDTFQDPIQRGRAIGIWSGSGATAFAIGPVVGGILVEAAGWRSIFVFNIGPALVVALLGVIAVRETPRSVGRGIDWAGQITSVLALGSLTFALIEGRSLGWTSPGIFAAVFVAIASGVAFVVVENRRPLPMLPLGLFRSPTFTAGASVGLLLNFAFYGYLFVLSLYLQELRGYSPLETGLLLLPQPFVATLTSIWVGRFATRTGARLPTMLGATSVAIGSVILAFADADSSYAVLFASLIFFGFGGGFGVTGMTMAVVAGAPTDLVGVATAGYTASRITGSVLGVAVLGTLLASTTFVEGIDRVAAAMAIGAVIAIAITWFVMPPAHVPPPPRAE
jgi:DHA2 family methylenomycin A resistance protein-like MFS transporter